MLDVEISINTEDTELDQEFAYDLNQPVDDETEDTEQKPPLRYVQLVLRYIYSCRYVLPLLFMKSPLRYMYYH